MLQSILFKQLSTGVRFQPGPGSNFLAGAGDFCWWWKLFKLIFIIGPDTHLRLSVLKAKHANWIVDIYNKFQSDKGVTIIMSGFRKADITEAIEMVEFPEQEPF